MKLTFKLEGLKELDEVLAELPKATARNVMLRTLKKQAEPMRSTAEALAPDDPATSGIDLHQSISISTKLSKSQRGAKESDVEVYVGPSSSKFYGIFQEFGAAHHGPHPFMRPAFDGNVQQALAGITKDLSEEVDKAVARLARKAERALAK